jgi:hypothetical protein
MSAGRSFHSVSGRVFWKEREEGVDVEEGTGEGEGLLLLLRGGGADDGGGGGAVEAVFDGGAEVGADGAGGGAVGGCDCEVIGGRLTAAARTLVGRVLEEEVIACWVVDDGDIAVVFTALETRPGADAGAFSPICRRTTHAVSGRSLK